jgi:hypothetical protein
VYFKPFDAHVLTDMYAAWKMTGLGGGPEVVCNFAHAVLFSLHECIFQDMNQALNVLKCMLVSAKITTLSSHQQWWCTQIT